MGYHVHLPRRHVSDHRLQPRRCRLRIGTHGYDPYGALTDEVRLSGHRRRRNTSETVLRKATYGLAAQRAAGPIRRERSGEGAGHRPRQRHEPGRPGLTGLWSRDSPGDGFGDGDPVAASLLEGGERVESGHILQAGEEPLPGLCSLVPLVDDEHPIQDPTFP